MDGPKLPPLRGRMEVDKAPLVMRSYIEGEYQRTGRRVKLVCTGPLTNIALLLLLFPEVGHLVDISLMGGGYSGGNITPSAECVSCFSFLAAYPLQNDWRTGGGCTQ